MNEIVIPGLVAGVVISLVFSLVLLKMGRLIDRFPTGDEDARERSIFSPVEFTRLSLILFWILYGIGAFMVLQGTRLMLVAGIAILSGICLYLITAVVFSICSLNMLQSQKKNPSGASTASSGLLPGALKRPAPLNIKSMGKKGK